MNPRRRQPGHVLFFGFPFPPSRGGGVFRTVAMANHLARKGWRVTVVTPEENYFARYQGSEDRSLLEWVSPRIKISRVSLTNWLREDDLRRKGLHTVIAPKAARRLLTLGKRYLAPLDHYPFWTRPALQRGLAIHRRDPVDVVLATGNPFNSFVVAAMVGATAGRPYVLDYRDAWTFDQFTGALKPGATDVALPLERRVLHGAAGLMAVNKAILDWLTVTHSLPGSIQKRVVENGYDPEFIERPVNDELPPAVMNGPRFSYVGTIIPEKLDWLAVLTEFDRVAAKVDDHVRLDIYGHLGFSSPQAADLGHLFEGHRRISYHGAVAKTVVSRVYATSDVLFLPMYESPYVTSGKVYEMMATGKPILAWGSPTAGAMVPLGGYPKLVIVDPSNPAMLERGLRAALTLARNSPKELDQAALAYAGRFERSRQLSTAAELIESVVRQHSGSGGRL